MLEYTRHVACFTNGAQGHLYFLYFFFLVLYIYIIPNIVGSSYRGNNAKKKKKSIEATHHPLFSPRLSALLGYCRLGRRVVAKSNILVHGMDLTVQIWCLHVTGRTG